MGSAYSQRGPTVRYNLASGWICSWASSKRIESTLDASISFPPPHSSLCQLLLNSPTTPYCPVLWTMFGPHLIWPSWGVLVCQQTFSSVCFSVGFSWLPSFLVSSQPGVELLKSLSSALFSSPSALSRILSINMTSSPQESWICTSSMAHPDVVYPTIRSHLSHSPLCLLIANNYSSSVISN